MFRPITVAAVLSIALGAIGAANAATYCASGGPERATSRSQCTYSSLADCRAGVLARGGGHCHKKGRYAAYRCQRLHLVQAAASGGCFAKASMWEPTRTEALAGRLAQANNSLA